MRFIKRSIASLLFICMLFTVMPAEIMTAAFADGGNMVGSSVQNDGPRGTKNWAGGTGQTDSVEFRVVLSRNPNTYLNGTDEQRNKVVSYYKSRWPSDSDLESNTIFLLSYTSANWFNTWNKTKAGQRRWVGAYHPGQQGLSFYAGYYRSLLLDLVDVGSTGNNAATTYRDYLKTANSFKNKVMAEYGTSITSMSDLAKDNRWLNYMPSADEARKVISYIFEQNSGGSYNVDERITAFIEGNDAVGCWTKDPSELNADQKMRISAGYAGLLTCFYSFIASTYNYEFNQQHMTETGDEVGVREKVAGTYFEAINDYLLNANSEEKPVSLIIDTASSFIYQEDKNFILPDIDYLQFVGLVEQNEALTNPDNQILANNSASKGNTRQLLTTMYNMALTRKSWKDYYAGRGPSANVRYLDYYLGRMGELAYAPMQYSYTAQFFNKQMLRTVDGGNYNGQHTGTRQVRFSGKIEHLLFDGEKESGTSGFMIIGHHIVNPVPEVSYHVDSTVDVLTRDCKIDTTIENPANITLSIKGDSSLISALNSRKDNPNFEGVKIDTEIFRTVYKNGWNEDNVVDQRKQMPEIENQIDGVLSGDDMISKLQNDPFILKDTTMIGDKLTRDETADGSYRYKYEINVDVTIDKQTYEFNYEDIVLKGRGGADRDYYDFAEINLPVFTGMLGKPEDVVIVKPTSTDTTEIVDPSKDENLRDNTQMVKRMGFSTEGEEFAEIKSNVPLNEEYEVMGGIPSSEEIYFSVGGSEFKLALVMQYWMNEHSRDRTYTVHFDGNICEYNNEGEGTGDRMPLKNPIAQPRDITISTGKSHSVKWDDNEIHCLNENHTGEMDDTIVATWTGISSCEPQTHSCPTCGTTINDNHKLDETDYNDAVKAANELIAALQAEDVVWKSASDKVERKQKWTASITVNTYDKTDNTTKGDNGSSCGGSHSCSGHGEDGSSCGAHSCKPGKACSTSHAWTITVTAKIPKHSVCGPCCGHHMPELWDTWRQGLVYDFAKIAQVRLFKLDQGSVDGLQELTGVDTVFANVISGNPTYFMNIAQMTEKQTKNNTVLPDGYDSTVNESTKGLSQFDGHILTYFSGQNRKLSQSSRAGRLRYTLAEGQNTETITITEQGNGTGGTYTFDPNLIAAPDQHDDVIYNVGARSKNCDGMATTGNFGKTNSNTNDPTAYHTSKTGHVNEWADGCLYTNILNRTVHQLPDGFGMTKNTSAYSGYWDCDKYSATTDTLNFEANTLQTYSSNDEHITKYKEDYNHHVVREEVLSGVSTELKKTAYNDAADERDTQTAEWQFFDKARRTKVIATVISDFLILQTSGGDQSVFYYEKESEPTEAQEHFQKVKIDENELFLNNPLSLFTGDMNCVSTDIKSTHTGNFVMVGGYNGQYNKPSEKYKPFNPQDGQFKNFGGENGAAWTQFCATDYNENTKGSYSGYSVLGNHAIKTILDDDPAKTITRPKRQVKDQASSFKVVQTGIQILPTAPNKLYTPENAKVFYSEVLGFYSIDKEAFDREEGVYDIVSTLGNVSIGWPQQVSHGDYYQEYWGNKNGVDYSTLYFKTPIGDSSTGTVNSLVVFTPVSTEEAMVMNQPDLDINGMKVSRDQRTNAFEYPNMNDLVNKLKVCPLDPELCEFRFLDCKFHKDTVLLDIDFEDTYMEKEIRRVKQEDGSVKETVKEIGLRENATRYDETLKRWITTNKVNGVEYILPEGFTIGQNGSVGSGGYLRANGTRWSLPFSEFGLSNANTNRITVKMDITVNSWANNLMPVSFHNLGFLLNNGSGKTGSFITKSPLDNSQIGARMDVGTSQLPNNITLEMTFSFNNVVDCNAVVNGVYVPLTVSDLKDVWQPDANGVRRLNRTQKSITPTSFTRNEINKVETPQNWIDEQPSCYTKKDIGSNLNIGGWSQDDAYKANFSIDNLQVILKGGTNTHSSICYERLTVHATNKIHVHDEDCYLKEPLFTCDGALNAQYVLGCGKQEGEPDGSYVTTEKTFNYTGSEQVVVLGPGRYYINAYGAQGGNATYNSSYIGYGGYGGRAYGYYVVPAGTYKTIYINVGGKGTNGTSTSTYAGGYNGGGTGYYYSGGGGGATSVALRSGLLSSFSSDYSTNLILAAGGGGGGYYASASYYGNGGYGGGSTGQSAQANRYGYTITGGSQSAGGDCSYTSSCDGSFGKGGNYYTTYTGGGGGGLYGGAAGGRYASGAGGSGYYNTSLLSSSYSRSTTGNARGTKSSTTPYDGYVTITPYDGGKIYTDSLSVGTDYTYSGTVKEVTLTPGRYKLEVWGAEGGDFTSGATQGNSGAGGNGGYSYGEYTVTQNTKVYVVVGSVGGMGTGGYNGGGSNTSSSRTGGGGATHISLATGLLSNTTAQSSSNLLLVAGGGGGAGHNGYGGAGGGGNSAGSQGNYVSGNYGRGGSSSYYYSIGQGEQGSGCSGGGGGGYYGARRGYVDCTNSGAGGGSGYINTTKLTSYGGSNGVRTGNGMARITKLGHTHIGEANKDYSNGCYTIPTVHKHNLSYTKKELTCSIQEGGYDGTTWTFDYKNSVQSVSLVAGVYKLEVWGAQGGSGYSSSAGGKGGYSVGELTLTSSKTLYIVTGGQGVPTSGSGWTQTPVGGYNGGGDGNGSSGAWGGAGGGATHIGYKSSVLTGYSSDYSSKLLLVAGGGGGGGHGTAGGAGGGESGVSGTSGAAVGTQNSGNAFGQGGSSTGHDMGAGGGGFYGAKASTTSDASAGGGSGYVNTSLLSNASTKAGNTSFPTTAGTSNETGHTGNGYAKITRLNHTHTTSCYKETPYKSTCVTLPVGTLVCTGELNTETDFNVHIHTAECLTTTATFDAKWFRYTGGVQTFVVPYTDYYTIEAYGPTTTTSGRTGYSKVRAYLKANTILYIYVGGIAGTNNYTTDVRTYPLPNGSDNVDGNSVADLTAISDKTKLLYANRTEGGKGENSACAVQLLQTGVRGNNENGRVIITCENTAMEDIYNKIITGQMTHEDAKKYLGETVYNKIMEGKEGLLHTWMNWSNSNTKGFKEIHNTSLVFGGNYTCGKTEGDPGEPINFDYTGKAVEQTLPAGEYKLEVWGAEGGSEGYSTGAEHLGGLGGYSVGTLNLTSSTKVYINVGEKGGKSTSTTGGVGGWNGGGSSSNHDSRNAGGGGGATDIRIGTNDLYYRVIVAGGGGGAGASNNTTQRRLGGYGGGTEGQKGQYGVLVSSTYATADGLGGTQSAGGSVGTYSETASPTSTAGSFGKGGTGGLAGSWSLAGGGGGWYGGAGSKYTGGGGGGSGYVLTSTSTKPSGYKLGSEYYLTEAQTIAGDTEFTAPNGSKETGHSGNGYARITPLSHTHTDDCIDGSIGGGTATTLTCGIPEGGSGDVYNYSYSGNIVSKTLTPGYYKIETWGAQGGKGSGNSYVGGKGAYAVSYINITSNTTYSILVGGTGTSGTGAGGGGGGSFVVQGTNTPISIAGGGGGAQCSGNGYPGLATQAGGGTNNGVGYGGKGGVSSGGGGLLGNGSSGTYGVGGNSFVSGGAITNTTGSGANGGFGGGASTHGNCGGGPGGGGYTGGGSGAQDHSGMGGYGGGSYYTGSYNGTNSKAIAGDATITEPDGTTATGHSGNGYVRITNLDHQHTSSCYTTVTIPDGYVLDCNITEGHIHNDSCFKLYDLEGDLTVISKGSDSHFEVPLGNINSKAISKIVVYLDDCPNNKGQIFLKDATGGYNENDSVWSNIITPNTKGQVMTFDLTSNKNFSGNFTGLRFDLADVQKTFTISKIEVYGYGEKVAGTGDGSGNAGGTPMNFDYTGGIQQANLTAGTYKLEVWGAQGGLDTLQNTPSGKGGYSYGEITLENADTLYVVVGGKGKGSDNNSKSGGYNGGGSASHGGSGGGATHIAYSTGLLSTFSSNYSSQVLIVAGGGGGHDHAGAYNNAYLGAGGGGTELPDKAYSNSSTVSSTTGYSFGVGQDDGGTNTGGGGGGLYGGYRGANSNSYSYGGGGSAYLNSSLKNTGGSKGQKEENGYARITPLNTFTPLEINYVDPFDGSETIILANIDSIPDKLDGDYNPIWKCKFKEPNAHACVTTNDNGLEIVHCKTHVIFNCSEVHHRGEHYNVSNRICWSACGDDTNHANTKTETKDKEGNDVKLAEFLQLDAAFTVYFPNVGDFEGNDALGLSKPQVDRGYGYDDNMDTTDWTREKRVKFPFDVIYHNKKTNKYEIHKGNAWIELDVPTVYFNFYILASNAEMQNVPVEFEVEAINGGTNSGVKPKRNIEYDSNIIDKKYEDALKNFRDNYVSKLKDSISGGYKIPYPNVTGTNSSSGVERAFNDSGYWSFYSTKQSSTGLDGVLRAAIDTINKQIENDFEGNTSSDSYIDPHENQGKTGVNNKLKKVTGNDNKIMLSNRRRSNSLESLHGGYKEFYLDVVGRIGNFALVDTEDYRFSEFFKVPVVSNTDLGALADEDNWLIEGAVLNVNPALQNYYVGDSFDIRGNEASLEAVDSLGTHYLNTYNTQSWMQGLIGADGKRDMSKPNLVSQILTSDLIHNRILKGEELRFGYDAYTSIVTLGSYTGARVQVVPKYFAMKLNDNPSEILDTKGQVVNANDFIPLDVYISKEGTYLPINIYGNAANGNPNINEYTLNGYSMNLDWTTEGDRRNYTIDEQNITNDVKAHLTRLDYGLRDEEGGGSFDGDTDTPTNVPDEIKLIIPEGKNNYLGTAQYMLMSDRHRTFIGSSVSYGGNTYKSRAGTSEWGDDKDPDNIIPDNLFKMAVQRWHGKLGVPSSAVFVPHAYTATGTPIADRNTATLTPVNSETTSWIMNDDWAIICTAEIIAVGDVWSIYYSQPWFKTMTVSGQMYNTVTVGGEHYPGHRVYNDNGQSEECPHCLPPIIAIYSSDSSSVDDVEIVQTH